MQKVTNRTVLGQDMESSIRVIAMAGIILVLIAFGAWRRGNRLEI